MRAVPLRWHLEEPHIVIGDGAGDPAWTSPLDSIPAIDLTVARASVEIRRDGAAPFRLEQIDADARRAAFGSGIVGRISGRLQADGGAGAPFAGTFAAGGGKQANGSQQSDDQQAGEGIRQREKPERFGTRPQSRLPQLAAWTVERYSLFRELLL